MSYARWGQDGSDVYVYRSIVDDESKTPLLLHCCWCSLANKGWNGYYAHAWDDMIAHLEEHRRAGHVVPDYTFDALRKRED